MYIKQWALVASLTVSGFIAGTAQAGGKAETAATLACVPASAAGPLAAGACVESNHRIVEIGQCIGLVKGKCMGDSNEIKKRAKKVKRWLKKL